MRLPSTCAVLEYHRRDGIDWKKAAWERLGTPERMQELGDLIAQAEKQAGTETERQRVALWRNSIWKWALDGRAEYEARAAKSEANPVRPAESTGPVDRATLDAWTAPFRGWHYYPDPIIPSDLKIP